MFGINGQGEPERPVSPARGYVRKGHVATLQFDLDAWAMLREIAPTQKAYGRYVSELIRRDYIRRQEWQQVRAGLPELVEVGTDE